MPYITCEITENGSIPKVINKETYTDPGELIVSLEHFRQIVNETFTIMIEDDGEIDDYINDDEEGSNDESVTMPASPKKRKK